MHVMYRGIRSPQKHTTYLLDVKDTKQDKCTWEDFVNGIPFSLITVHHERVRRPIRCLLFEQTEAPDDALCG